MDWLIPLSRELRGAITQRRFRALLPKLRWVTLASAFQQPMTNTNPRSMSRLDSL